MSEFKRKDEGGMKRFHTIIPKPVEAAFDSEAISISEYQTQNKHTRNNSMMMDSMLVYDSV